MDIHTRDRLTQASTVVILEIMAGSINPIKCNKIHITRTPLISSIQCLLYNRCARPSQATPLLKTGTSLMESKRSQQGKMNSNNSMKI